MVVHRIFWILISAFLGSLSFSFLCSAQQAQMMNDLEFTSLQQDTVDTVVVYSVNAFYGERGVRAPNRIRNQTIAEGLEFKVRFNSMNPAKFSGHHRVAESEPNNNCLSAQLVSVSEMINAYIDPVTDVDYYEFLVHVIDTTVMVLEAGRGASPGAEDIDTIRMWLYDPTCTDSLAYAEDSLGAGVKIVHTFTNPGDFYYKVKISGTGNDTGNYAFAAKDTLFYIVADTLPWYGEHSIIEHWPTNRFNVFPDSLSVHFLGAAADHQGAIGSSSSYQYIFSWNFDIHTGILVPNPPNPPDTIHPDTFVVIDFTRAFVSDTLGVLYYAAAIPCTIWISQFGEGEQFIRGDADGSGALTLGDGLRCFRCQFVPGWQDSCRCDDAVDADDSGAITIGDCLRILRKQFVPGWQDSIPAPCCDYPGDCGSDPTQDNLDCGSHPCMGSKLK